jgi:hypothetical protein
VKDSELLQCLSLGAVGNAISLCARTRAAQVEKELSDTLAGYLAVRIEALEERVKLLDAAESLLETEKVAVSLDRRDLQIQRAQMSYQSNR